MNNLFTSLTLFGFSVSSFSILNIAVFGFLFNHTTISNFATLYNVPNSCCTALFEQALQISAPNC